MGLMDKMKKMVSKDKVEEVKEDHGDKIADGVDKATDVADDKTGGAHSEHLDKVDEAARDALDSDSDGGGEDENATS